MKIVIFIIMLIISFGTITVAQAQHQGNPCQSEACGNFVINKAACNTFEFGCDAFFTGGAILTGGACSIIAPSGLLY